MEERCILCGDIIPEGIQVCPACFEKYGADKPVWRRGKAYCSGCGKRLKAKDSPRYCSKCGKKIRWE